MNVVQSNFQEFYDEIKEYAPKAEFYSIDFEMTGIRTTDFEAFCDLPYEKYLKLRGAANKYRIIQMGICLFIRTADNQFDVRPYNIYLFPREYGYVSPQISIDVSAAEFNTKHHMNWNMWFREGVTYMTLKEAKKRRAEIEKDEKKNAAMDSGDIVQLTREDEIEKSKKFTEDLDVWIASKSGEKFVFEESNRFFRRHIYDTLRIKYPDLVHETISKEEGSDAKEIHIYNFLNEEDRQAYNKRKEEEKEAIIFNQVGFTNVIQLLIDSKKPVIGHNCYFDWLFLYSHFIETLPYSFAEFKKKLNNLFPILYDTKFISNYTDYKKKITTSSSLDYLINFYTNQDDPDFYKFTITLEDKFKAYEIGGNPEDARYHEAGYDSFITGLVYARMYFALKEEDKLRVKNSFNTMKHLYYLKLDNEDPMYKPMTLYVFKQIKKTEKIGSKETLALFEELNIGNDNLRFAPINQSGFAGGMLILDSRSEDYENQKELMAKKIEEIKATGAEILSWEEYSMVRKEAYDKGDKNAAKAKEEEEAK